MTLNIFRKVFDTVKKNVDKKKHIFISAALFFHFFLHSDFVISVFFLFPMLCPVYDLALDCIDS